MIDAHKQGKNSELQVVFPDRILELECWNAEFIRLESPDLSGEQVIDPNH